MINRRFLIKAGLIAGAGLLLPWWARTPRLLASPQPGSMLEPGGIPKYQMPLFIPPAMPKSGTSGQIDYYEIAVRQFSQQILPVGMPMTTVWGYGSVNHPQSFNYPACTIEAAAHKPVRIKWINDLKDANGNFLPHLLPVDPTLHWANPPGGTAGRDSRPTFSATPGRYTGPVPMVTHVHGAHAAQESDGYAEAWFLPAAGNIPGDYAKEGTWYGPFKKQFESKVGAQWEPGSATCQYQNDQHATALWYHDHTLGMTRVNMYAGPTGFYIIRGGSRDLPPSALPGPAPGVGDDPSGKFYEIPLVIQDRSFNNDGSLFYPDSRTQFDDGFAGPYIPLSDVPPIWNPELFGNTIVVNGRTWPYLNVEPRRYRLRLLNGCNSRFLILKMTSDALAPRPAAAALPLWQIGSDGGFLRAPARHRELLMAPAERADVIVDFTGLPVGTELYLINEGPDEPFGGGVAGTDFMAANPATTGQVMKFVVGPLASKDASHPPATLTLPGYHPIGAPKRLRKVSLNEEGSSVEGAADDPIAGLLGTLDKSGQPVPRRWDDAITENPALNDIEAWDIYNYTDDAHPIHIHLVQFQLVSRRSMNGGHARSPGPGDTGLKDTIIAYPGEITRVKAKFDLPGLYVWHCHILEHEDNEMMRPYFIGPNPPTSGHRHRK